VAVVALVLLELMVLVARLLVKPEEMAAVALLQALQAHRLHTLAVAVVEDMLVVELAALAVEQMAGQIALLEQRLPLILVVEAVAVVVVLTTVALAAQASSSSN
jgi:hypothetical protein